MRNFTQRAFVDANINLAENINEELKGSSEILNGQLDHHNLPLISFNDTHIADQEYLEGGVSDQVGPYTDGSRGPFNGYYLSKLPSAVTFSFEDGEIVSGWNPLVNLTGASNPIVYMLLDFQATEGMIKGSLVLTGEKLTDNITKGEEPATIEVGHQSYWQVGVFCNGVLIAQSGAIPPGVYTIDLPFSTPIGNQQATIEAKFAVYNTPPIEADDFIWQYRNISFLYGALWARNARR